MIWFWSSKSWFNRIKNSGSVHCSKDDFKPTTSVFKTLKKNKILLYRSSLGASVGKIFSVGSTQILLESPGDDLEHLSWASAPNMEIKKIQMKPVLSNTPDGVLRPILYCLYPLSFIM